MLILPALDPKLFLEFLSRPRRISEIADHFAISTSEAERLVMRAVESGEVLLKSLSGNSLVSQEASVAIRKTPREIAILERTRTRPSKLPSAQAHMVQSNLGLGSHTGSLFKTQKSGLIVLRRKQEPIVIPNFARRKKSAGSSGSLSIAQEIVVYEALLNGAKTSTALRTCAKIPGGGLHGLVRKGLVVSSWGPKGVGVLFEITQKGIGELERLRAASRIGVGFERKNLISSKTVLAR